MKTVELTVEDGIVDITGLPEDVKIIVKNIDQDSDMVDVLETTHELVNGKIEQTDVKEYDLPEL